MVRTRSSHNQSRSFIQKKRNRVAWSLILSLFSIGAWLYAISTASFLSSLTIDTVHIDGGAGDTTGMMAAAYDSIDGSYGHLLSRSNTFIYPEKTILDTITSRFPTVRSVNIERENLHTLRVTVSRSIPEIVICRDLPDFTRETSSTDSEHCYAALSSGFILREIEESDPQNLDHIYMPDNTVSEFVGTYATSSVVFDEILHFIKIVRGAHIKVVGTLIGSDGNYEVYIQNMRGDSVVVVHATHDADMARQAGNLVAFWQKVGSSATPKNPAPIFDEIKLQYPPNVYYTEAK